MQERGKVGIVEKRRLLGDAFAMMRLQILCEDVSFVFYWPFCLALFPPNEDDGRSLNRRSCM